jgi:predicted  nucleic acid-binding Zn-ribbon protein
LQADISRLELQREAALSEIGPDDLLVYTGLRKSKRGLAVVRLDAGSCAACGVAPSTSRIDSAQSGQEIVQCSNCGRILYLG